MNKALCLIQSFLLKKKNYYYFYQKIHSISTDAPVQKDKSDVYRTSTMNFIENMIAAHFPLSRGARRTKMIAIGAGPSRV